MHAIRTGDCAECGETDLLFIVIDPRTEKCYGFCRTCIEDEFDCQEDWEKRQPKDTEHEDHQGR